MRKTAGLLVVVLFLSFVGPPPATGATGAPIDNEEQRVSEHGFRFGADQFSPDVSGETLVWQDTRGDNDSPEGNAIWSKDLSTRDESPVTTVATPMAVPQISGTRIAWTDNVGGNNDIYARQLPAGPVVQVTTHAAIQINPAIDGTLVVWEDLRNQIGPPNRDIFKKDLAGGPESAVVTASGDQFSASVSATTVAWRDSRRGPDKADVYVRTGSSAEVEIKQVDGSRQTGSAVAISGSRLFWNENDPSCVGEGCETPKILRTCVLPCASITTVDALTPGDPGSIGGMDVSGSQGVWVKSSSGGQHIYARDLATFDPNDQVDTTSGLPPSFVDEPSIDGTRTAWTQLVDTSNGRDVFWRVDDDPPQRANSIGMGEFGVHLNPAADGDVVVYRAPGDLRLGGGPNQTGQGGFRVWATDLSGDRRHFEVSTFFGTDVSRAEIASERVVWSDARNCPSFICGAEDVFERDPLDSGNEVQLSGPPDGEARTPDVDGSTTAWQCGDAGICVHDGSSIDVLDVSGNLLADGAIGTIVRISGDLVVWHEVVFNGDGPSNSRIHALDIVTEDDEILGAGLAVAGDFSEMDIEGSEVVWAGGNGAIWRNTAVGCGVDPAPCDHSADASEFETPATDHRLGSPSIGGTRVAWTDCDGMGFGVCDVYTRTLAEPDRHLVTNESAAGAGAPFVDVDRIYWSDSRNAGIQDPGQAFDVADIFMESVSGAALPQPDTTPPGMPTDATATRNGDEIDLAWTNPTDDDFYRVRILRKSGTDPPSGLDDTSASVVYEGEDSAFTDTDVAPGLHYSYAIVAFDSEPNFSSPAFASTLVEFWFNWYDGVFHTPDWVMMVNTGASSINSQVFIAAAQVFNGSVAAGGTLTQQFPGQVGGPVRVVLSGPGEASIRSLWTTGSSTENFEEVSGVRTDELGTSWYWPWYDGVSTGGKDWIHISNPNPTSTNVTVKVAGSTVASSAVPALGNFNYQNPNLVGGPVEVSSSQPVLAAQRVLWDGVNFSETLGTQLTTDTWFTWYDYPGSNARDWIVIGNPGGGAVTATITVAGNPVFNGAVGANTSVFPTFPGVVGGPVHVTASGPVVVSQRAIWGLHSMEEVGGTNPSAGGLFSWYDAVGSANRDWVLVANVGGSSTTVTIKIAGATVFNGALAAGQIVTPQFTNVQNGPVQVTSTGGSIITSRRTLWGPQADFTEMLPF